MSARGKNRRAFRPGLGGPLESRLLLATTAGVIQNFNIPPRPGFVGAKTADHGRAVAITDVDGELYVVNLLGGGTVRAVPRRGGIVDLVVDGSNGQSELTINPFARANPKHTAHNFPLGTARHDGVLHVGNVTVNSGAIGSVLGYKTAVLSGVVRVAGTTSVDRVAFQDIVAGGGVVTGGDLNTLDVYHNAAFAGPTSGLNIGRDLNSFTVKGNLTLSGNASITVNRDLGLFSQAAKGSGPGGVGISVLGNVVVNPGSSIRVLRTAAAPLVIQGSLASNPVNDPTTGVPFGDGRISLPNSQATAGTFFVFVAGTYTTAS